MQASAKISPHYYEGLDAWRGIAVLSVMISHYFGFSFLCKFGWVGVDMFFVLSGFLITGILLKNKFDSSQFFSFFWFRRVLRIIPVYALVLVLFYVSIHLLHKEWQLKFYTENWWYFALFLQNWLFFFHGLPKEGYLNHLWSLSVEEQFYLIWPFIIYYVPQKQLIRLICVFISIVVVFRSVLWFYHPTEINIYYCNTFTRIDSICMGCLLYCTGGIKNQSISRILISLLSALIIFAIFVFRDANYTNPFFATIGFTLIAFVFYLLLGTYIQPQAFLWIKKIKSLNYIGKISYCMYLVHLPVYLYFASRFPRYPLLAVIAGFSLTLLFSALSFELYEKKFLKLKRYFTITQGTEHLQLKKIKNPD